MQNFSGDSGEDYFADGMTEALIADLAQIPSLRVISRTSSMSYKQSQRPLREIAGELGVRWIIEGSVVLREGRVRVTAQLIDARTDEHRWARIYDRAAEATCLRSGRTSRPPSRVTSGGRSATTSQRDE